MIRRFGAAAAFLVGIALASVLAVKAGLPAIQQSLVAVGWARLAAICILQLVSVALCAGAWRQVARGANLGACFVARWIRDGSANLVGFIPAIGETISARALALLGAASAGGAAASTIVDVGVEALAQAVLTLAGLLLLLPHLGLVDRGRWGLIVAAALAPILLVFWLGRHPKALALLERWALRIAEGLAGTPKGGTWNLAEAVHAIYRMRWRVSAAFLLHLAAWMTGPVQVWLAVKVLQHPLDFGACVALYSLVFAARSAFFLVPWAAGVQEGGFLLVGAALGLTPAESIALSLILRARDVLIGAPGVLFWYVAEGRSRIRRPGPSGATGRS